MNVTCNKCRVSKWCPKKGFSPTKYEGETFMCKLIGNYGRNPIDRNHISDESLVSYEKNGPCLTLMNSWEFHDGTMFPIILKVWSPPILSPRETKPFDVNQLTPRSHR
jgi:hypothetical protein